VKGKERSKRSRKPSFPGTPPIGGNEQRFSVIEVRDGKRVEPVLMVDGIPVPFPVAYVKSGEKIRLKAVIPERFFTDPDRDYWAAVNKRIYPQTAQAHAEGKATASELLQIFAVEAASLTKNPAAVLDNMPTKLFPRMITAIKGKSSWARLDPLDHLLLRSYRKEGWDQKKVAEVGKLCGKLLKQKSFPPSTIKDRLRSLELFTRVRPGAPEKAKTNEAVRKYLLRSSPKKRN